MLLTAAGGIYGYPTESLNMAVSLIDPLGETVTRLNINSAHWTSVRDGKGVEATYCGAVRRILLMDFQKRKAGYDSHGEGHWASTKAVRL